MRMIASLLLGLIVLIPAGVRAATPAEIDQAIKKGKEFIYSKYNPDLHWEVVPKPDKIDEIEDKYKTNQWGGLTAIATYALLASGENYQEPRIAKAIDFLKKADLKGVYAIGLRAQVWLFLPPTAEIKSLMVKDAQLLRAMVETKDSQRGFYDYYKDRPKGNMSLSRSQYGVLGIWAAAQMGVEVPSNYWRMVEDAWLDAQDASGAWAYYGKKSSRPVTPGITAVGIATLYLTQDYLHTDAGVSCKPAPANVAIEKGMAWMAANMDKVGGSDDKYQYAYMGATLYAVERIGVASGLQYIGTFNWYDRGAEYLLPKQRKDGSWGVSGSLIPYVADTSFCMLFLSRGRAPVIFGKLDYSNSGKGNWNIRPRDVANVTRWIGRSVERDLNWQVMNLGAGAKDLNDVPVLFMSGNEVLDLTDSQAATLKTYVEQGGMIFGHADCGQLGFSTSFQKLGTKLFPKYEFRELPAEHPIYSNQQYTRAKWKTKLSVLGLSNGVRELMLIVPQADIGKQWQLNTPGGREESFQLAANIGLYAVDKKNLRYRGDSYLVDRKANAKPSKSAKLARLEYADNWDPEPAGWRRLSNLLANRGVVDLKVEPVKLGSGSLDGFKLAHLTGTTEFKFDNEATTQLKKFVESGGTLIIDSAGGSSAFATSVEVFMKSLDIGEPKQLPGDHAIYTAGGALKEIAYRPFARNVLGNLGNTPRVQSLEVKGRPAVFYSREDLSGALVGQHVDGIVGYEPATGTEIMIKLIQHATK